MKNLDSLYKSWIVKGSYFNKMLYCGQRYNQWVENALTYLPQEILFELRDKLAFFSTAELDGCRIARAICEQREIILLSERILPKRGSSESQRNVRYFIYVVLHEVAHVFKKHRSPLFDRLTEEEVRSQEKEADELALKWFNKNIERIDNPYLKPITFEEIEEEIQKNQKLMQELHEGL